MAGKKHPQCNKGHDLTPDNCLWWTDKRDGRQYRKCRICKNSSNADYSRRNSLPMPAHPPGTLAARDIPEFDYEKFSSRYTPDPVTGCWNWSGATNQDGYGQFCIRGNAYGAHRVSYTHCNGRITPGLQIDHLCRNRRCVRPDHLEAVTPAVNNERSKQFRVRKALRETA